MLRRRRRREVSFGIQQNAAERSAAASLCASWRERTPAGGEATPDAARGRRRRRARGDAAPAARAVAPVLADGRAEERGGGAGRVRAVERGGAQPSGPPGAQQRERFHGQRARWRRPGAWRKGQIEWRTEEVDALQYNRELSAPARSV